MSAYKFYGPHVGVLFAKRALFEQIDFPKLVPAPDYAPENAETGTQNQEGMVGAGAAVEFLASLGGQSDRRESLRSAFHEMHARNSTLFNRLWKALSSMPRVTLYGPTPDAATHADIVIHDRRLHFDGRSTTSRGKRTLPVTRRLLRLHDRATPRPGA